MKKGYLERVLVSVLQRQRTNRSNTCICMREGEGKEEGRRNCFKELELAHKILGTGKYEFCRTGQQARNSGKSHCNLESESAGQQAGNLGRASVLQT